MKKYKIEFYFCIICHNKLEKHKMTEEEQHEWMLLYVSENKKTQVVDQTHDLDIIKCVLGMTGMTGMTDIDRRIVEITESFWSDNETRYLQGDMFEKKLPIVNLRDRLNAVECMMKLTDDRRS